MGSWKLSDSLRTKARAQKLMTHLSLLRPTTAPNTVFDQSLRAAKRLRIARVAFNHEALTMRPPRFPQTSSYGPKPTVSWRLKVCLFTTVTWSEGILLRWLGTSLDPIDEKIGC